MQGEFDFCLCIRKDSMGPPTRQVRHLLFLLLQLTFLFLSRPHNGVVLDTEPPGLYSTSKLPSQPSLTQTDSPR